MEDGQKGLRHLWTRLHNSLSLVYALSGYGLEGSMFKTPMFKI